MAYNAKTNWALNDAVMPEDMNRIEQGIKNLDINKANASATLVGKYHQPTVTRAAGQGTTSVVNPIPINNWVENSATSISNEGYAFNSTVGPTNNSTYPLKNVATQTSVNEFRPNAGTVEITLTLPAAIKITQVTTYITPANNSEFISAKIMGSNNQSSWTELYSYTLGDLGSTAHNLTTTGEYRYYKWVLNSNSPYWRIFIIAISGFSVTTYSNAFSLSAAGTLENGQRIMIEAPSTTNSVGVTANTLNTKAEDLILQPNTKYELVYNGTNFNAKEVV